MCIKCVCVCVCACWLLWLVSSAQAHHSISTVLNTDHKLNVVVRRAKAALADKPRNLTLLEEVEPEGVE